MLKDIRKYYDLIKTTELKPLYDDDFDFEVLNSIEELERHTDDLDEMEQENIFRALEPEFKTGYPIIFYSSEAAGDVYGTLEDFLVYLLNEILYQKLLSNIENRRLSNYFMELEISIKKQLISYWTR